MNGDQPKIEIFEPFGAAFELMKRILFQPFDFAKWLVIGFAAFLLIRRSIFAGVLAGELALIAGALIL
jgi:hypothetical protein